jgi:hypothetical protein
MARDYEDVDIDAHVPSDFDLGFLKIYETWHDHGAATYDFINTQRFDLEQVFTEGTFRFEFYGNQFQHQFGVPTTGTIKKIKIFLDDVEQAQFTDFSASIRNAYDLFTQKSAVMVPMLLNGNNTFNGSSGIDFIKTYNGNDNVFGNGGGDTLYGGRGDDRVYGGIGINDVWGNKGSDKFYFDVALDPGNNTRIQDFSHKNDSIYLDTSIFVGLPESKHRLAVSGFSLTEDASNTAPHVWYDKSNGNFWYVAGGVSKHFGEVDDDTNVTRVDFILG